MNRVIKRLLVGFGVAAVLAAPSALSKLETHRRNPVDIAAEFMVRVVLVGAALTLVTFVPIPTFRRRHRIAEAVELTCPLCDSRFNYGPNSYEGKHISAFRLTVCNGCFNGHPEGWPAVHEPVITAVLRARSAALPPRSPSGLLPRNGRLPSKVAVPDSDAGAGASGLGSST